MAYYDNYLIDTSSRVILEVEATPALFHQETAAARKMMERSEKLGLRPKNLAADKAYGSGAFLAWLLARGVEPHIPVIDRRHQTGGRFTHDQFRYDPAENAYYCPEGKALRYRGLKVQAQSYSYCSTEAQCHGCPQKQRCTTGAYRALSIHWDEAARQSIRALAGTPAYERSRRARYKDRSPLCRAQATYGSPASTTTPIVERLRTVPAGSYGPEYETVGAVSGAT
jgi:hypothetical protein